MAVLHRLQDGHRVASMEWSFVDVVRYAAHWGVNAEGIDTLPQLYREPGTLGYWMSDRLSTLVLHETTAVSSSSYDPVVVPGLLQTEEYATELISTEQLTPGLSAC